MKQEKNIETKAESQNRQGIQDAFAVTRVKLNQISMKVTATNGDFNIFLTQNLGKGPPGRSRSPVAARGHPPENKAGPPCGSPPINQTVLRIEKEELINKKQILNFYKHLIFIIMKKQILFLAMFTLALIFAGTKSYGQVTYVNHLTAAPSCASAVALGCASEDALRPLPGKVYTYSITVDGQSTAADLLAAGNTVRWFVTDQLPVISEPVAPNPLAVLQASRDGNPGTYVLTAPAASYNLATTAASIAISWKTFDGNANKVLLVAYISDGCTDNVVVFRIIPSFAFTLDVAALLVDGTKGATECVSRVETATYVPATPALTMNYGENWVFFSVTAANFVNSWLPDFSTTVYAGGGTLDPATIQWAYSANAQSTTATDWHASTVPVAAQVGGGAVGATGECIVVRARIVNASSPLGGTLTFGVDGTMFDPAAVAAAAYTNTNLKDLDEPASGTTCINTKTDQATYTITERPVIVSTTPDPPATGTLPYVTKVN